GLVLEHIVNGGVPVLPALSAGVYLHDLVVVDPFAEALPYVHPLFGVDQACLAVLAEERSSVAESCVHKVPVAPHGLPSNHAVCCDLLCCRLQVLPCLNGGGVDPC